MCGTALLFVGLATAAAPPATLRAPSPKALTPERLTIADLAAWPQPFFLQADRRGAVTFLRAEGPRFVPLLANGKLGEPGRWEPLGAVRPPLRAAMSRDGDWVLFSPPEVRLFRDGKETKLAPLEWSPIDVGFLRDDPVVNTGAERTRPHAKSLVPEEPPLVLRWTGKEWEPFLREPLPPKTEAYEPGVRELRTVHLLGDSRGTLWLANENLYRIRRYSAGGKLKLEITRGPQQLVQKANAAEAQSQFERSVGPWKAPQGATAEIHAATSRRCLEALAEGRDGMFYFLADETWPGGSFALDRFNPGTQRLERVLLALRTKGYVSMAAGKDGLYFGSFEPKEGPWRLPWVDLDQARWTPLRDAKIDRVALEDDETRGNK